MNKIYNLSKLSVLCLMLLSVCIFTACDNDDDNGNQIVLNSFGPSPALRGGELRFIGQNLGQVQSVEIPGSAAITDIQVVDEREIRVTIPQDATVGKVTLKTPQGDIVTLTDLTYEEPITVDNITTSLIKAGSVFTIEGDYLNLIAEVIFFDNAVVEQPFVSQSRKKIEVLVPAEAQSGKIRVSNGAEIPIEVYSGASANIVAATVTSVAPTTVKPGTALTMTGTNLDLIGSVRYAGGVLAEITEPVLNDDNTKLTVTVPLEAPDGAVTVIAKSGIEYLQETELTMIVPTSLVATPNKALKPGDVITIKGVNMDLVTNVTFANVPDAVGLNSQSATEIKVTVPAAIKDVEGARSGDLTLNMANGKTVTVAYTMLQPVVTSYKPSPVTAGGDLTIVGTNMNLVKSVTFTGDVTSEPTSVSATQIVVKVPVDAVTGAVTLTLNNGEPVTCADLEIISPVFCFIPELPGDDVEIKSGTIFTVEVVNGDKLMEVQASGVATQYILNGSKLSILAPSNAAGSTTFTLISSNGEVSYSIFIAASVIYETIWTGSLGPVDWSGGHTISLSADMLSKLQPGRVLGVDFTCPDWSSLEILGAWWGGLPSMYAMNGGNRYVPEFMSTDTNFELPLAQGDIDVITGQGNIILFVGGGVTISRVYVKIFMD